MIKKRIAYGLFLIANILLLAHAVIPHHHHGSVVCVEQTHCHDDALPHNHHDAGTDHQHDGDNNSSYCILKQSFVDPSSQGKQLKSSEYYWDHHYQDYYILSNFGLANVPDVSKEISYVPVHSTYILPFVTLSLGLRAPPTV